MKPPESEAQERALHYAQQADLRPALAALRQRRDELLERWLEVVVHQPFHRGRRESAVADHIPALFDALLDTLEQGAPRWLEPDSPLANPAVVAAAQQHAAARYRQGLQAADVVIEFRLLRQEIWRAMREQLPDSVPTSDVLATQLLLNDAIDGAIGVGLNSFVQVIEELKEEFLLTVAHDLRNPLTSLKATAQLLARQVSSPPPDLRRLHEGLLQIDAQADRLAAIVTELLDASRMRLGRFEITPAPTVLPDVLQRVVSRLPAGVASRLRLRVAPESTRPGLWDSGRLESVLENLIANAVKFSPSDSPIEVAVEATEEGLTVTIRDYGEGLEGPELTRLFERFYRASQATEGSGLGLYIARGIVEAHGGRIWATSPGRGQGTTVAFTLPWAAPASQATA
jgi:signal transduction histidine kinase